MDKDIKEIFIYLFIYLIPPPHQNTFEKETKAINISSGEG